MRNRWRVDFNTPLRHAIEAWQCQAAVGRRPKTIAYNKRLGALVQDTWAEDLDTPCANITPASVARFGERIGRFSASQYNHLVNVARALVPAAAFLPRRKERPKVAILPSSDTFERLIAELEKGRSHHAADIVRLLACTGLRISEALALQASDVLPAGLLVRDSKNGRGRLVPFIGECRAVVDRLLGRVNGTPQLVRVRSIRKALNGACQRLNIPHLSHHDFRRLFATRCIESRVDLPTAARWLGHSDGGALLGRTYFHLLDEHSAEMAARVKI